MEIKATEFNEPQCGKDQADRDSAVIKSKIENHLISGQDVDTASKLIVALRTYGGIRNMKCSSLEISPTLGSLKKLTVPGISSFHSVDFEGDEIRFRKYFNIGDGILVKSHHQHYLIFICF
jgi:hypothetical protein